MFLVLDADALLLVGQDHSVVKGYRRAILTPNVMEFKRLSEQVVSCRGVPCSYIWLSEPLEHRPQDPVK